MLEADEAQKGGNLLLHFVVDIVPTFRKDHNNHSGKSIRFVAARESSIAKLLIEEEV